MSDKYLDDHGVGTLWAAIKNRFAEKENGKGLSEANFTAAEKTKLGGIEAGANNYVLPAATANTLGGVKTTDYIAASAKNASNGVCPLNGSSVVPDGNLPSTAKDFTSARKTKLDGIADHITSESISTSTGTWSWQKSSSGKAEAWIRIRQENIVTRVRGGGVIPATDGYSATLPFTFTSVSSITGSCDPGWVYNCSFTSLSNAIRYFIATEAPIAAEDEVDANVYLHVIGKYQ